MFFDSGVRRLNSGQQQQAVHVINAYAEAMSAGKKGNAPTAASRNGDTQHVPADELFAMMGAKVIVG